LEDESATKDSGKNALGWLCDKVGILDLDSLAFVTGEI